jgi:pimeloyl-ACP methyl ester carboxylesterase
MSRFRRLLLYSSVLPLAGMAYQWIGAVRDRRRFLQHGTLLDVENGRRAFFYKSGLGNATVIFESGISATHLNWARVQAGVSGFARTFSYDRAGLGWSDPAATERTPSNIAVELRLLLRRAGIAPPYLLIGHSFGGLVVRRYAIEYPEEVTGVLLVDAMRTKEWPPMNQQAQASINRGLLFARLAIPIAMLGVARLAATSLLGGSGRVSGLLSRAAGSGGQYLQKRVTSEVNKMPREVWPIVAAHWSRPDFYRGLAAHIRAVPASIREMDQARAIEGLPVCLLTPGTAEALSAEELRRIGTDMTQVIAEKSAHWVHLDEPELVVETIRKMIDAAPIFNRSRSGKL